MAKETLALQVNGQRHSVTIDPDTPLLYVLRNQLALNGPRYGCGLDQCGACMALLDGRAVTTCRMPVSAVQGRAVTTLEGLEGPNSVLHPLQGAFEERQAAQCGYCLNGVLMAAADLLAQTASPDRDTIEQALEGVLCRCGTHTRFLAAIEQAAEALRADSDPNG